MESGLLLDVVVGESAAIFELFAGEDEALLVRGDTLLVLDLLLYGLDGVRAECVPALRVARAAAVVGGALVDVWLCMDE